MLHCCLWVGAICRHAAKQALMSNHHLFPLPTAGAPLIDLYRCFKSLAGSLRISGPLSQEDLRDVYMW